MVETDIRFFFSPGTYKTSLNTIRGVNSLRKEIVPRLATLTMVSEPKSMREME
jgi:hypothetical protein